ncbi:MAG: RNA pseudouridine synthase [Hydrogenibacillus schlegelii]|uniref:RNA pseudouridylate synthase n=2 Tax=Hydrogenibacillus schlegelii TaxID=1484 RepID=A0A947GB71_HYDSH|nr:RNA pseudouridine synthase [Hydrogenibacillus schlegelii]
MTDRDPVPDRYPVLYEDNHLIAVVKPPGLAAQGNGREPDLLAWVKARRKALEHKKGEAYVGLVHRLDRPTGGVMVFAKTSKAAARLSAAFREQTVDKRYLAVIDGHPRPPAGRLVDCLKKRPDGHVVVVRCGEPDARKAVLDYALLGTRRGHALLDIRPRTGRPHQIRVQLAAHLAPIAGDRRYHPRPDPALPTLALWAYALVVPHPTTRAPLLFSALPDDLPPWPAYRPELAALRAALDAEARTIAENTGGTPGPGGPPCPGAPGSA